MEKPKKNKPYMMYLKQSFIAAKPQYHVYRGGKNVVYTIEGDVTRHRFSVRQGENEVLVLRKKIAKLFAEYTIEKDGHEIAHIKKDFSAVCRGIFMTKVLKSESLMSPITLTFWWAVISFVVSSRKMPVSTTAMR